MGCLFRLIFLPFTILIRIVKIFGIDFGLPERELPTMVMLDCRFNKNPQHADAPILWMKGRTSGIIAWILYKFNLLSISQLTVTSRELKVEVSSLAGTTYFVTPLAQLTTSNLSLEKPLIYLYRAGMLLILLLLAIVAGFLGFDLIAIGVLSTSLSLIFWYWYAKRLVVAFSTSELDDIYGLGFEPSWITGITVEYNTLLGYIQHINYIVVNSHYAERTRDSNG